MLVFVYTSSMDELNTTSDDLEADAIKAISKALRVLPDNSSRELVLEFVANRFSLQMPRRFSEATILKPVVIELAKTVAISAAADRKNGEIAGIAKVCESLLERGMSSRNELTPILKQWRVYDGNTRAKLGADKGILRDGDTLTLDAHARRLAEQFIDDVLNPEIEGKWKPS